MLVVEEKRRSAARRHGLFFWFGKRDSSERILTSPPLFTPHESAPQDGTSPRWLTAWMQLGLAAPTTGTFLDIWIWDVGREGGQGRQERDESPCSLRRGRTPTIPSYAPLSLVFPWSRLGNGSKLHRIGARSLLMGGSKRDLRGVRT